jgi:hypothetical protein
MDSHKNGEAARTRWAKMEAEHAQLVHVATWVGFDTLPPALQPQAILEDTINPSGDWGDPEFEQFWLRLALDAKRSVRLKRKCARRRNNLQRGPIGTRGRTKCHDASQARRA